MSIRNEMQQTFVSHLLKQTFIEDVCHKRKGEKKKISIFYDNSKIVFNSIDKSPKEEVTNYWRKQLVLIFLLQICAQVLICVVVVVVVVVVVNAIVQSPWHIRTLKFGPCKKLLLKIEKSWIFAHYISSSTLNDNSKSSWDLKGESKGWGKRDLIEQALQKTRLRSAEIFFFTNRNTLG